MVFGSQEKLKCEVSVELISAFTNVILNSGDRVGFILYNRNVFNVVLPKNGTRQYDILVHELSTPENYEGSSSFSKILQELSEILAPPVDIVVLISDFLKVREEDKIILERIGNVFETMAISIKDPLDTGFPDIDKEIVIEDPESGEKKLINPKIAGKIYKKNAEKNLQLVQNIFKNSNIDFLNLYTNDDYIYKLAGFLIERASII